VYLCCHKQETIRINRSPDFEIVTKRPELPTEIKEHEYWLSDGRQKKNYIYLRILYNGRNSYALFETF